MMFTGTAGGATQHTRSSSFSGATQPHTPASGNIETGANEEHVLLLLQDHYGFEKRYAATYPMGCDCVFMCRIIPIVSVSSVVLLPTVQSLQPLSMQEGDEKHQNENENQFGIKDDGYLRERLHFIC